MNSFETDMRRAICSRGFFIGFLLELAILFGSGFDTELFRMSVPIVASFPYSTAWISDDASGFIKAYLPRTNRLSYIAGKFAACGISGGLVEAGSCFVYMQIKKDGAADMNIKLIFLSAVLWAVLSAALAAWSGSRYIAYGGAFVIYYLLIILYERYFKFLYCLYPREWILPEHTWIFDEQGIVMLLSGFILIIWFVYYEILRRCMRNV